MLYSSSCSKVSLSLTYHLVSKVVQKSGQKPLDFSSWLLELQGLAANVGPLSRDENFARVSDPRIPTLYLDVKLGKCPGYFTNSELVQQ